MNAPVRLGFVGTGNIASAVVESFCTSKLDCRILVSPRNEAKSQTLAARFPQVRRAASNQAVLDGSDIIVVALRPDAARETLPGLRFRKEHTVLSFIPVIPREAVSRLVGPAGRVFKVLPLAYTSRHLGLVPYFPRDAEIETLVAHLAEPLPVKDQRELHLLWAITGLISPFYALLETTQDWCVAGGADPETSRRYTASMYAALAGVAEAKEGPDFSKLAAEAATPGGLNEMALNMMRQGSAYSDLRTALDAVLVRFGEAPEKPLGTSSTIPR